MSMSLHEAESIAFDPIDSHSTVSLDLAARLLVERPAAGRDAACYAQLAALKARLQRIKGWAVHRPSVAPETSLDWIARLANGLV